MITIPQKDTKKFSQPNYGDTQGNLWGTFGVDLTKNTGRVRVTRTEAVFSEDDDNGFSTPSAFAFFDMNNDGTREFITYANKIYIGGSSPIDTTWVADVSTNSPTGTRGDMVVFNGKLYVTGNSKLKRIAPGAAAWTDITSVTGITNQLCVYKDKLYIVTANKKVISMNLDESINSTGIYTLDLSFESGYISWIEAGSNRIWIGVLKNDGTNGEIYEWDGQTENGWSKNYIIEAQGSTGCTIWNDIPYVMDIEGRLLAFNGSGFQEVARLPIMQYYQVNTLYASPFPNRICHFNGIKTINDSIVININNTTSGSSTGLYENYPSGIYEYTKENGLIHKYAPSITIINEPTLDYGQHVVVGTGAIFDASSSNASKSNNYSTIMFGFNAVDSTGGNDMSYINVDVIQDRTNDPKHKRLGYIITPFLESTKITDVWKSIIIKYRKMLDATDRILVKYRTTKDIPVVKNTVTWTSDTQLTATTFTGVEVGMEVEVLTGNGAGAISHVTSITDNTGSFTITLEDSILGVSSGDKSNIRFQKWNQLPITTANDFQFNDLTIPQYNKDTEMQFKIVMNWTNIENELREVIVVNETDQHAK